jgi:hypothetical protein
MIKRGDLFVMFNSQRVMMLTNIIFSEYTRGVSYVFTYADTNEKCYCGESSWQRYMRKI